MAAGISVNPANLVRVSPLNADLGALDWLARGTFNRASECGLSLGVGFEY